MNRGKCALEREINHKNIDDKFRTACSPCTLFSSKVMCAVCCLRISKILEALRTPTYIEPGFPSELIASEIKQHKENIVQQLPSYLKEYYEILPNASGKDWDAIARECGMCPVNTNLLDGGNESIRANEAKPMTPVKT